MWYKYATISAQKRNGKASRITKRRNAMKMGRNRSIPATKKITVFFHCKRCLAEGFKSDEQQMEVGYTPLGIQVWCKRHDLNILHMDLQGCKHPANTTAGGRTRRVRK